MTHVNRILSICTLALSCASVLAANAPPPPVAWTAHDISGNEVRVPVAKPAAGPAVLLFAMADQTRSRDAAKQLTDALKVGGATVIVVVSGEGAAEGAHRFAAVDGATWPIVADPDYSASGAFNVHVWPTTVIVSPEGAIVGHVAGLPKSYLADVEAHVALASGRINQTELEHRLSGQSVVGDDPEQMAARHVTVAERLLDKDLKQEAGRELDAAIKLNPSSPQTKFAVARLSLAVGRTDAAATVLESIPANTVSPSQMNLLRGKVLCAQGKWDPAIALLTDAVKLNPQPAEAWYSLGRAYEHLNQLAKAAEAYRKAFESTDIGRKLRQD